MRFVLGCLPQESFTKTDWLEVVRAFGFRCAYCGERRTLVMDHAVPISKANLGEHRLGNLVPAFHPCNAAKGQKSYDVFLHGERRSTDFGDRIAVIERHMAQHGYRPLSRVLDQDAVTQVQQALDVLREAVASAAAEAVSRIHELTSSNS